MNCESVRKQLALLLYGELAFEEEEAVHQHLEGCAECRLALDRQKALHGALDEAEASVPDGLLAECRRDLRAGLERTGGRRSLLRRLWDWTDQPVSPLLLKPAGALALVALGFFAARLTSTPAAPPPQVAAGPDPATQQVLLQAARNASDPGLRMNSMEVLGSRAESPEVRQTLVNAVRSDPNSAVRLRAVESLRSYRGDPQVRLALENALFSDDNLGVRTQAIDILVMHKDMAIVGTLQHLMEREQNDYIRQRCEKALSDMNASMVTF